MNEDELVEAVKFAKENKLSTLVIGGGSNLLVSDSGFDGLVILNEIMGKKYIDNLSAGGVGGEIGAGGEVGSNDANFGDRDFVLVEANAGEDWESLVAEIVGKSLYGLENLSSIPGKVGASPIQNIGAYGVDVSSIIQSVRALDITTMKYVELSNADCKFAYRDSLFKNEKGRYIVSRVIYKLTRNGKVQISYRDLQDYFRANGIAIPSLLDVRNAVVLIRKNKLPDWTKWGTAGSFFKNPIVSAEKFQELKAKYPELPGFPESDGRVKVSLGWILDKVCDAKNMMGSNVSVYEKQALVLVSKPGATATEVIAFARKLMDCVMQNTGINIESEVEWTVV
jgi:UDP-N-acetylmuramate dehydrogenase